MSSWICNGTAKRRFVGALFHILWLPIIPDSLGTERWFVYFLERWFVYFLSTFIIITSSHDQCPLLPSDKVCKYGEPKVDSDGERVSCQRGPSEEGCSDGYKCKGNHHDNNGVCCPPNHERKRNSDSVSDIILFRSSLLHISHLLNSK